MMKITRVRYYELDDQRRIEYFVSDELAHEKTKDWPVTDWGWLSYDQIEVTER
jgi:hypothetical protein